MSEQQSFTIMTYNVFCRESKLFKDSQNKRCSLIPKNIHQYSQNIDCIIVQEIFDESAEKILDDEMKKYGFEYKSKKVAHHMFKNYYLFTRKIIEDGGIKIYSKIPIDYQEQMIFKNSVGEDSMAGKGVCYIRINKYGKNIHIFGTHLQSGKTNKKIKSKFRQIKQFKKFINKQKISPEDLVILGGDFNLNKLSQSNLIDNALEILDCKLVNLNMDTYKPERNDLQLRDNPDSQKKQHLLDHFFISNKHLQLECKSMFVQLKSENYYKIKKLKKCKPKFIKNTIFGKLKKYSKKKIKLYALSNHEPIVAYFILN